MQKEKIQNIVILSVIILIGLIFRFRHWPDYLTFDFEKARDLIASINIFQNKKLTLLGPTTEVEGIFHGPLYYYLVGFCYFLFKGDPKAGSIVSFFFNLACIPILFFIGKDLFNRKIGFIAALFYAISFEAVSYSYWLSNPGPSVPFLFLMFYFFYKFCTKDSRFLILSLFCLGLSIQFQILNVVFTLPLIIMYFVLGKTKIKLNHFFLSLLAIFVPLSTFVLFELKHKFLMTNAFILNYFPTGKSGSSFSFNPVNYWLRITKETSDIFFPPSQTVGIIIFITIITFILIKTIRSKLNQSWKFLFIWIFSTLPIFLINSRMSQSSAAFIGTGGAIILAFSALIENLFSKKKKLFLFVFFFPFFFGNLYAINHCLTNPGCRLFDYFEGLFLKKNFQIINYVYEKSNGKTFQLDTVTSPLYVSPLWDYLFEWHSRKNNLRSPTRENAKIHFLIMEPYVDQLYKNQAIEKKEKIGTLSEEKSFEGVVVQKWTID